MAPQEEIKMSSSSGSGSGVDGEDCTGGGGEEMECPLCLSDLAAYDRSHPLQCPSLHCHFNCCMGCLEHMIAATKDEKTEASDGNVFRTFLHCPNCRSNLGPSIRDTVLLRKVDKFRASAEHNAGSGEANGGVCDEKMTATELRFIHALEEDADVASAVEDAKHREDEFFGRGVEVTHSKSFEYLSTAGSNAEKSLSGSFGGKESVWSFDDEEGVEADLSGPHKSFIYRHHSQVNWNVKELEALAEQEEGDEVTEADTTLLCGLDAFMTEQEQIFVTAQLVSGDTSKLAAATEMMHYVSALSREGRRPSMKRRKNSIVGLSASGRKASLSKRKSMLTSIKEVIREGNEARKLEEEKQARRTIGTIASQLNHGNGGSLAMRKRLVDVEMRKNIIYMKSHPLPLRMPKYAEATASKFNPPLTFLDYTWDGTVLDAYAKITVSKSLTGNYTISKQHAESSGIRRVIDASGSIPQSPRSHGKGYIDIERPRVIVGSMSRELGSQGVCRGDVVTHFNGEEFVGTAAELTELLNSRYDGEVLTFVFNADAAVAEALKRRSMISD